MIKVDTLCKGALTRFKVDGTPTVSELISVIEEHYHTVQSAILWNFSGADISQYTDRDMHILAGYATKHAQHKKAAFVGKEDLQFGLLRMYEAYAEMCNPPPIMRSFRNESDALQWLQGHGT